MRPDASRLVYRIKSALKGESNGLETANLAWQYAAEIEHFQNELKRCLAIESDLEAYLSAYASPNVLDTLDTLDFSDIERWNQRCEKLGWREAGPIDHALSKSLRDRFSGIEDPKSWLLTEFRAKVRAKQTLEAFQIANLLEAQFGDDASIAAERARLETQVIEQAESELSKALQDLMPTESSNDVLARYERFGFVLPEKQGPLKTAKDAASERELKAAQEAVDALVEQAKSADSDEDRFALETAYFDCDLLLALTNTRSKLDPERREALTKVVTDMSRFRGGFESNILIQSAVDDLRNILKGLSIRFGPKKATVHDAKERLKSLQRQAKKMGHRIASELEEEIGKVLSEANRKRAPKYAIIGFACLIVGVIVFSLINSQVERNRFVETLQEASSALKQASARQEIPYAERALSEWQEVISSAPPDHALKADARALENWIAEQRRLETAYADIADKLEAIRSTQGADPQSDTVSKLLVDAKSIRADLARSSKNDADGQVEAFTTWQSKRIAELESERKRTLIDLMSKAQDHLARAAAAPDEAAFDAQSMNVVDSIAAAQAFLTRHPDLDPNALQQRSLTRIADGLKSLQERRNTMRDAQKTIGLATDLPSYLQSLEAIYNFDTLSSNGKRDIGRILKLESAFDTLLQSVILPGDKEGWIELAGTEDYASVKPELSDVEKVFLERLISDSLFPTIYESSVKYFEGDHRAKSEYTVFLVDPIQKGDTAGLRTGTNFSFLVRGFDESGEPESQPREMNFLSHPDGTFWGFFYTPSALSKESVYFQETLRLTLMQALAGAPRFTLLATLDELSRARTLSPAFRAYWQQQLVIFMEMNPWKWGLPLSPIVESQVDAIKGLVPGGVSRRLWLSTVEQISPSIELTEHFRSISKIALANEAKAFASLYEMAFQGEMTLVGRADESGNIEYSDTRDPTDRLWIVNKLTGRIERLTADVTVAPYSPVLAYRFEGQPASRLLQKTRMLTGIDLSADAYGNSLPPLLR